MILNTSSENETIAAARDFAKSLTGTDVILLSGGLGMGKSVFSRAVIRALVGDDELDVPSPTFTLVQTYNSPKANIYHFDLYRLKSPDELYEIGWEDALGQGVMLIEWPEKLGYLTPKNTIKINITAGDIPTSRVITVDKVNNGH